MARKKKKGGKKGFIVVLLILAGLAGAGYYGWANRTIAWELDIKTGKLKRVTKVYGFSVKEEDPGEYLMDELFGDSSEPEEWIEIVTDKFKDIGKNEPVVSRADASYKRIQEHLRKWSAVLKNEAESRKYSGFIMEKVRNGDVDKVAAHCEKISKAYEIGTASYSPGDIRYDELISAWKDF